MADARLADRTSLRAPVLPTSALRRAIRKTLFALALGAVALAAEAAIPEVGQVLNGAIDVRALKKLPLPPGQWRVQTAFEESVSLDNLMGSSAARRPLHVLVLANEDPGAEVLALVLEFTESANISWQGQPCDNPPSGNVPLVVNTLGTSASSLQVRCNRVYAFANLRAAVQRPGNPWFAKRFEKLQTRAASFPVHGLVASGYVAAPRGDRVQLFAYANPARHGLDGDAGAAAPFRAIDAAGARAAALREYLKTFAEWLDSYTHAIDNAFLGGRSPGTQAAPSFQFGQAPATVATPALPPPAAAPPAPWQAPAQVAVVSPQPPPAKPAQVLAPQSAPQKVHALVIGNGAYPGARLVNPRNDAEAVAERFRRYGFAVTTVLDASRRRMVEALGRFTESARDADLSIVFYAGHGVQVNGVNYLIPVDMDLAATRAVGVAFEAVSMNALLEDHLPGKAKIVFLDACRDNPLARSLAGTRGGTRGLAAINAATGTLISYATRDGSTAADGDGSNSPYTAALLAHLDEAEDISILLRRVRQRVMTSTKGAQEPWEYGSLIGDKLVLSQIAQRR